MIFLQHVSKAYEMGDQTYQALQDISLEIASNESVAIMGPSGSGKTTTMNIIGLLDRPTTGQYLLDGQLTKNLTMNELASLRNRSIGFIFQSFFLLPKLSALDNVGLPLHYAGMKKREIREKSQALLEQVGMGGHSQHKPNELSGGQQQRVAIARALVNDPKIILADEPTGALDSKTSDVVMNLLLDSAKDRTVVIITHDPEVAACCPRVVQIQDGRIA